MKQPVRPKLPVPKADEAIEWYVKAFDARLVDRYAYGDRVVYASIEVFGGAVGLKDGDEFDPAPQERGVLVEVDTDDPDRFERAALEHGGTSVFPVADQAYGARGGRVRDPFGHEWLLQTPLADTP
jgi:PhnB protein